MEKNGYLDHKEKGEEADGATHGNDEKSSILGNGEGNSWKK